MDFEALTISEFLGILLIGLPILVFLLFIPLEFIARIREHFEKQKSVFHHHFHYKAPRD